MSFCTLLPPSLFLSFFFNDTATTEIYPLSLHDALPICDFSGSRRPVDDYVLVVHRHRHGVPGHIVTGRHGDGGGLPRSEEHTSELQSHLNLVCRLLLEKKKKKNTNATTTSL